MQIQTVFQLIFLARGHVIFQGVAQSRSTWLTAAAALCKAYGVGRGWGVVEHTDKGLILILILEMFDI